MSRNLGYRNDFQPVIRGSFNPHSTGTMVQVLMRPHQAILIFMAIWLGITGITGVGIITYCLSHLRQVFSHDFSPVTLVPIGMFLFGCCLCSFAFKAESYRSKKFLAALLEAKESGEIPLQ